MHSYRRFGKKYLSVTRFSVEKYYRGFLIRKMADVLIQAFRQICLSKTSFSKSFVGTIRLNFLKLGIRITISVRIILIAIYSSFPHQKISFRDWWLGLKVLIVAIAIQQIQDNIVAPRVMGNLTGLNLVIIFAALLFGGKIGRGFRSNINNFSDWSNQKYCRSSA